MTKVHSSFSGHDIAGNSHLKQEETAYYGTQLSRISIAIIALLQGLTLTYLYKSVDLVFLLRQQLKTEISQSEPEVEIVYWPNKDAFNPDLLAYINNKDNYINVVDKSMSLSYLISSYNMH
ncbi:hypothetical protein [Psychrosphaera algicola]|uniref:Uncharacterized protein n=1 Tax=Psychrosphaera algicola TaxID=3023714 RepID=A0ABT5F7X5_9GAMM|nr:hypothetical protein [Psychrosphaera sp. G1-22]MDC2887637.1 hypothetical protein [Psychrosphaera sp. G1-22]